MDINAKTTLAELGGILFKQIREESVKEFIMSAPIENNIFKGTITNVLGDNGVIEVVINYSINGIMFVDRDKVHPLDGQQKYYVRKDVFFTKNVFEKVKDRIITSMVESFALKG